MLHCKIISDDKCPLVEKCEIKIVYTLEGINEKLFE